MLGRQGEYRDRQRQTELRRENEKDRQADRGRDRQGERAPSGPCSRGGHTPTHVPQTTDVDSIRPGCKSRVSAITDGGRSCAEVHRVAELSLGSFTADSTKGQIGYSFTADSTKGQIGYSFTAGSTKGWRGYSFTADGTKGQIGYS